MSWFQRPQRDRLQRVRDVLRRAARGELDARVPEDYLPDDIGEIEKSLNETLERTTELVDQLREGTRVLVHEMKYPFIAARTWMVRAREKLPASNLRDELDQIIKQIDAARSKTETLADIAIQVAERHNRDGFEPTAIHGLCEDAVLELADFAAGRRQYIESHLEPAIIAGKPALFFLAVRNLLSNACNYSPLGSTLWIGCGTVAERPWLEVHDAGPGFPSEVKEEFEGSKNVDLRARNSRALGTGGAGLGLRLSRQILIRHKAIVSIRPRSGGEGSIVRADWRSPSLSSSA